MSAPVQIRMLDFLAGVAVRNYSRNRAYLFGAKSLSDFFHDRGHRCRSAGWSGADHAGRCVCPQRHTSCGRQINRRCRGADSRRGYRPARQRFAADRDDPWRQFKSRNDASAGRRHAGEKPSRHPDRPAGAWLEQPRPAVGFRALSSSPHDRRGARQARRDRGYLRRAFMDRFARCADGADLSATRRRSGDAGTRCLSVARRGRYLQQGSSPRGGSDRCWPTPSRCHWGWPWPGPERA